MPPRTTRKSTRPRASDRTMVDTVQPPRLPSFRTDRRRRYQKMKLRRGSNTRPQLRRTGQQNHVLLIADRGWMPRKSPLPPVEGKVFSLTSPFIEQGLSLVWGLHCCWCKPRTCDNDFLTMSAPSTRVDFGESLNHRKAREKGAEHADYRFSLEMQFFLSGRGAENPLSFLCSSTSGRQVGSKLEGAELGPVVGLIRAKHREQSV